MSSNLPPLPVAHAGLRTYDVVSRCLHWLTLLLVLFMLASGWGRDFVPISWREFMSAFHVSLGLFVLLCTLLRLLWWCFRHVPPSPLKGAMQLAATATHLLLYAFLLALPICGWLMVSAFGHPPKVMGLLQLPPIMMKDRNWGIWLKEGHALLAYAFFGFIVLHAVAALVHHYVLKDGTLARMLPKAGVSQKLSLD